MSPSIPVRRIAVIGAGPSGLAAVKYLLAEKCFEKIDVYERRDQPAGVWNYCPATFKQLMKTPVPQTTPNVGLEEPIWHPKEHSKDQMEPTFVSPIYSTLDTNIPKELMAYGEKAFPADSQELPKYTTVKQYLDEYAAGVKHLVQFETQVLDVRLKEQGSQTWALTTRNLRTRADRTETYDAVIVASGHFDVPYLPDIVGIKDWDAAYPGNISHSKLYDSPDPFRGKKVIVVGSSASGLDIGNQINKVSKGKVLASHRVMPLPTTTDKIYVPEIVEFLSPATHDRAVRFADGRVEAQVDAILFCTGYFYSFPFLSSLDPPVVTDGRRVENIYQHLFYAPNPTLIFPVLPQRIIPFPLAENQAAVFSRVLSGRLALPSYAEMKEWESSTLEQRGSGTPFHLMPFPLDADYMNMLHDWASKAEPRPGLSNDQTGKRCNRWGEKNKWIRQLTPEIRRVFFEKGEERRTIKSLEELGYNYEQWQKEQATL
ncbi:putative flavin dependent monooxygenase [Aspergillus campestris IBT 28561]|uniref:Flavin dependent monooxygenase n=1 Tax=Aspergillus campestris (strain IBT 28561) TaxID=1392248 RepID=A0A2I1D1Y5_ASPC2|nr:putative flavin dependent monooxygenase [Aspergillus campestris IBT 28561]PKY03881.1 putative flavin dependent monooxygenase [Aspergillus campestris IBT 28561]